MEYKLFLLEDDRGLVEGLTFSLAKNGFAFDLATTVQEAKIQLTSHTYDLLLLDITLPDGTGFQVCQWLRERGVQTPVIFLTALDDEISMVRGLDMGGDDYITKPFKLSVLFSRIHAVLRRTGGSSKEPTELCSAGVRMQLLQGKVFLGDAPIELTGGESRLLRCLMEHPGQVLSAGQLLGWLWDCEERFVDSNTLSVYIRRLRKKIEDDPSHPKRILTIRGMGYQWNGEETS